MRQILFIFLLLTFTTVSFAQKAETMAIKVFFHNEKLNPEMMDCNKVYPTTRTIPKTKATARAVLEELFKGTTADEQAKQFWAFPAAETTDILIGVKVKSGAAYVNFNKSVYDKLGNATTSCGGGFFAMVEATLKQFPTINKVFYAIEGKPADFYEWVQVGECPKGLKNCDASNF